MEYHASGKLLLFGEYLVLKGAKALAIPLKYGQIMTVESLDSKDISWVSSVLDAEWFSATFTNRLEIIRTSDSKISDTVRHLLKMIQKVTPALFNRGLNFTLEANFPMEWGLGSSSTLISLLAQWSGTDPYKLLENSFEGSGYDVACATAHSPLVFEMLTNSVVEIELAKSITERLLFVYSGKKQVSKKEVLRFEEITISSNQVYDINKIVLDVLTCKEIEELEILMEKSEELLSNILSLEQIKNSTFNDYMYSIKSLGAWGGDFFMATYRNEEEARDYFKRKGYAVQFTYDQIIKK